MRYLYKGLYIHTYIYICMYAYILYLYIYVYRKYACILSALAFEAFGALRPRLDLAVRRPWEPASGLQRHLAKEASEVRPVPRLPLSLLINKYIYIYINMHTYIYIYTHKYLFIYIYLCRYRCI